MKYFLAIFVILASSFSLPGRFDDQASDKLKNYLNKLAEIRREKRKYPDNMNDYIKNLVTQRANPKIQNDQGTSAIFFAVANGDQNLCKFLLEHEQDIEDTDRENLDRTPLHVACDKGLDDLVFFLLENNANVDATDRYKDSSLTIASAHGHANIIRSLVKFGANLEAKNKWGETSCFVAVKLAKKNALNELITLGANIDQADMLGQTPFEQAIKQHDEASILLLLDHHANAWKGQVHPLQVAYQVKRWRIPRRVNSDPPSFFKLIYDKSAEHYIARLKTISAFEMLPDEIIAFIIRWILAPWTTDTFILELQ